MPKYQAIFSGETHSKEILGQRCVFVISLSFQKPENLKTNDLSKYIANIERLNSAFVKIDVVLSDSLNRHNASIYYPNSNTEKKALSLGDKWLKTPYHQETNKLKNTSPIIRWADLLSGTDYKDVLEITEAIYKKNSEFSAIVEYVCAKFVAFICDKRKKAITKKSDTIDKLTDINYSNFDIVKAYESCLRYVLEECAITLMFRLRNYTHLFHIGKVNDAVDWVAKNSISYLPNCNKDLINKLNNNPLKITIPLQYKPCQTATMNIVLDNTGKVVERNQIIKKNAYFVSNFFKHLQSNFSKSTCDISNLNQTFSERRKSCH